MSGTFDGSWSVYGSKGELLGYVTYVSAIRGGGWDIVVASAEGKYIGRAFLAPYDEAPQPGEEEWLHTLATDKARTLLLQHKVEREKEKEREMKISAAIKEAVEVGIYWHRSCGATELFTVYYAPKLPIPKHEEIEGIGEDFARGKIYFKSLRKAEGFLASSEYTEEAGKHAIIELLPKYLSGYGN